MQLLNERANGIRGYKMLKGCGQTVYIGGIEIGGVQYSLMVLMLIIFASWMIVRALQKKSRQVEEAEKELEQTKHAPKASHEHNASRAPNVHKVLKNGSRKNSQ